MMKNYHFRYIWTKFGVKMQAAKFHNDLSLPRFRPGSNDSKNGSENVRDKKKLTLSF